MITNFRGLLDDRIRIEAFRKAISEVVNDKKSVLEIGSALGTYSFFAAQNNAKSIYAVEMDDIFYVGEEIAKRNGMLEKIHFIKGKSTDVDLPEKVDYIIMEDYSPIFLYEKLELVITDARKRFLKPDGKFIPNTIILKTALVEAPSIYNEINLWENEKDTLFDINWDYTTELAFNRPYYAEHHKLSPLCTEQIIKSIDLSKDNNFPFSFKAEIEILQAGIIHGITAWWDTYFTTNIFFPILHCNQQTPGDKCFFLFAIQSM